MSGESTLRNPAKVEAENKLMAYYLEQLREEVGQLPQHCKDALVERTRGFAACLGSDADDLIEEIHTELGELESGEITP